QQRGRRPAAGGGGSRGGPRLSRGGPHLGRPPVRPYKSPPVQPNPTPPGVGTGGPLAAALAAPGAQGRSRPEVLSDLSPSANLVGRPRRGAGATRKGTPVPRPTKSPSGLPGPSETPSMATTQPAGSAGAGVTRWGPMKVIIVSSVMFTFI